MLDLADTIESIISAHRRRCYAMEQRKRANLSLGAFLRIEFGWSKKLPEAQRSAIAKRTAGLIKTGEKEIKAMDANKPFDLAAVDPEYIEVRDLILASIEAREPFDDVEAAALKRMVQLAQTLPVWPWCEGIRGFGPASLAVIVGEAGDLGGYPKKGHLWKRMGVAVIDGTRQGGLSKNAKAAEWIEHGYSRQRRSRLWNIGDALIKGNGDGEYRQTYLARKEYERERARAAGLQVVPAAKIPKGRQSEFMSDGHIHLRAQRYMEKRLLRNLWQAWRRAEQLMHEDATYRMPAADNKPMAAE
jgi:hypothetical protein